MRATPILMLSLLAAPVPSAAQADAVLWGQWRNPRGSVDVQIASCGPALCGTVVRASAAAVADARAGGTAQLVGRELMHGYRHDGPNRWSGTVYVPDVGQSFSSHIQLVDRDHARIAGCLLGRFLCKSQVWRRL
ncbi:DUF2147 domain-containing protein [Novosphingobium lentum]|uniref:DUF2147 domain-containing protein n=1 Tax=Novosphingobium lentum TaxID=145287 RepID=UPI00082F3231|nr:DUF2147 domain-containing protein [Novosphingobium lentum]